MNDMFLDKIFVEQSKLSNQNSTFIELLLLIDQEYIDSTKSKISENNLSISIELHSIENRSCPLLLDFKKGIDDDSDRVSVFFLAPDNEYKINAFYYERISSEEEFNFYREFLIQIFESDIVRLDTLKGNEIYSSKLTCSKVFFGEDNNELMPFYGSYRTKWFWQKDKFDKKVNTFRSWRPTNSN